MKNYYLERAARMAKLAKQKWTCISIKDIWRIKAATYLAKANGYNGAAP